MTADGTYRPGARVTTAAELVRQVEAWIRHGEAVPADVTTYDRGVVHAELRQMIEDARPDAPQPAPDPALHLAMSTLTQTLDTAVSILGDDAKACEIDGEVDPDLMWDMLAAGYVPLAERCPRPDAPQPAPACRVCGGAAGHEHDCSYCLKRPAVGMTADSDSICDECAEPTPTADAVERAARAIAPHLWSPDYRPAPFSGEPTDLALLIEKRRDHVRGQASAALAAARAGEAEGASCGARYCTADAQIGPHRHADGVVYRTAQRDGEAEPTPDLSDLAAVYAHGYTNSRDPEVARFDAHNRGLRAVRDAVLAAQRGGEAEPSQDAEGALREAMTDVLAIAEVPDEDAPTALLASLRDLGWVLTPARPAAEAVDREAVVERRALAEHLADRILARGDV